MSIIKTENLTHLYGKGTPFEKAAIHDVNLEIEEGELVGVIGHTGSGKSTLIQHLNGLLKPTSGRVYIDGADIFEDAQILQKTRFKVGLVFQYPEYQLFEETVEKDIAFGPKNLGFTEAQINETVSHAMECVGLPDHFRKKSPFELSGGQKRRVAIAGVIAMRPKVLILDEPTAGLDPKGRDTILDLISNYHRAEKNTVLLVSHSMEDVAKYCSKVLVMNQGSVFSYGTVAETFSRAEEIEQIGLSVPQVTRLFSLLSKEGFQVGEEVYTIARAKEILLKSFLKKREGDDVI